MKEIKNGELLKRGDLVFFDGGGPLFKSLSFLLGLFDPDWRRLLRKPWHVGIITSRLYSEYPEYLLLESVAEGVIERPFYTAGLNYRIFRWLDQEPDYFQVRTFVEQTKGCKYDVAIYFLTAITYLVRRIWNHRLPKVLDNRFSCWELLAEFVAFCGKPLVSFYDVPMISDILRSLGILPLRYGTVKELSVVVEKGG